MTSSKTTKRALLGSVVAMLVCFTMLLSTTFAWFTDTAVSANNKIVSGTLKIDLELLTEDGWASIKEDKTPIFDYDKWEPGYTDVKILKVENEGNLALKWYAKFVSANDITEIADVIDVYVLPSATEISAPTDRNLAGYTKVGTVAEFINSIEDTTYGTLKANEVAYLGIALKMQETAGNEYQDITLGAFDIMILATQETYEKDSFDDQYDKDAEYPVPTIKAATAADLAAAFTSGGDMPIALTSNIDAFSGAVSVASVLDLGGYSLTSTGIGVKEDLSISNGTISTRTTSGYLDIRPTTDDVYVFENVDFVNEYKRKANSNTGSDRIEYMLKLYPMAAGLKSTFIFENCTFDNASLSFGASSDKFANVNITFKNCTFNAIMGSDAVIEFKSTITGTVNIENCTFNIDATYANQAVIDVPNWSSVTLDITATNNTLNANKAVPYTYDPAKGETEVDSVKIGNVSSVRNYYLFDSLSAGYSTLTEVGTVLQGEIAIASK